MEKVTKRQGHCNYGTCQCHLLHAARQRSPHVSFFNRGIRFNVHLKMMTRNVKTFIEIKSMGNVAMHPGIQMDLLTVISLRFLQQKVK
jgi:hypothetical protein